MPGHPIQAYLQQAPEDGNILSTLPHAEWEAACQRAQLDAHVFDQQFYQPPVQGTQHDMNVINNNNNIPASAPHPRGAHRRRHKHQAKHLRGVGSQFDAPASCAATPGLAQDQGMMGDLRHLAQFSQQDGGPSYPEYEEAVRRQMQEMMGRSLHGVGSQFPQ